MRLSYPFEGGSGELWLGQGGGSELLGCPMCGLVQRATKEVSRQGGKCCRCGTRIARCLEGSRRRTLALALAALALYMPANIYPVMSMDLMGRHSENTVWSGVVGLWQDGQYFIGGIVFLASILIPGLKLSGLFFLALAGHRWPRQARWIYETIDKLGPWAMLDVFLLAIAVALVKFGQFGHVSAEPGIIWFALVVVLTLLASGSFDPRVLWEESDS
ncbi:MAG: paraquat-inducible protein A [Verrucomicrobia bacterium]|nr:MAG: paraquat-inducible protein A [Verrucomicrobiota bacterium]